MQQSTITIDERVFPLISVNTVIVGTGAASLNCAVQLDAQGCDDLLIITERIGGGTSNNTGSDKQTYYKLSLSGNAPDCVLDMADSLFSGGGMHGDIALIEATLSAQSFYHLVQLGVPFPHTRFGGYVGYKTDHDPRQRATSAGPKTSMLMFEALYSEVQRRKLPIMDHCEVIRILTQDNGQESSVIGLLCWDTNRLHDANHGLFLINATNVVYGTGGPSVIYKDSVYPTVHTGSTGLAFEAGIPGQNLTEWQYGLASIKFRWNVSGTYMQVLPRFISTDQRGHDPQEFLNPYFPSMTTLTTDIFLKGYQWPFDPRKVQHYGSSLIDILVYQECVVKHRRVFLDYLHNPSNAGNDRLAPFSFDILADEAKHYLSSSYALLPTPLARLQQMNPPAIELYREQGIDLTSEPLEVAVCAQHNNGGLQGNIWWESPVKHFFPIGEVNGSHGVYRPGGSALNAGQCGAMRAAQFISKRYASSPLYVDEFMQSVTKQVSERCAQIEQLITIGGDKARLVAYRNELQARMSSYGAQMRDTEQISGALVKARKQYDAWAQWGVENADDLPYALKNRDAIITQIVYLAAMEEYARRGGVSRGSYMIMDRQGVLPCDGLGDDFRFRVGDDPLQDEICEAIFHPKGDTSFTWVTRRPLPVADDWFENIWSAFREDRIIRKESAE